MIGLIELLKSCFAVGAKSVADFAGRRGDFTTTVGESAVRFGPRMGLGYFIALRILEESILSPGFIARDHGRNLNAFRYTLRSIRRRF